MSNAAPGLRSHIGKRRRRPVKSKRRRSAEGRTTAPGSPDHAGPVLAKPWTTRCCSTRRLWSIFMSAAQANENQQPIEVRQNIANIGVFVMKQTVDMQLNPDPAKLKPLIDINCNLAAGLSGRG